MPASFTKLWRVVHHRPTHVQDHWPSCADGQRLRRCADYVIQNGPGIIVVHGATITKTKTRSGTPVATQIKPHQDDVFFLPTKFTFSPTLLLFRQVGSLFCQGGVSFSPQKNILKHNN